MSDDQYTSIGNNEQSRRNKRCWFLKLFIFSFLLSIIFLTSVYVYINSQNQPPATFPIGQQIPIEAGTDVRTITHILESEGIVKSKHLLYYTLVLFYDPTSIKASTYIFDSPITTRAVAKRLAEGDFDTDLVRFTHFEGERFSQIANRAEEVLPNFNEENFTKIAEEQEIEGKLFPETYFVPASYDEQELFNLLKTTFDSKIAEYEDQIHDHDLSLTEILVLASIIEREANSPESMKLVSSVLQNRLEIGMALQADASIEYVLDKPLSELTPDDLEIDTPYNTYLYPGLPPTPIGNPGLDAIEAVLEPTESDYFYYITDNEGVFHYSETYNGHLRNIDIYLR